MQHHDLKKYLEFTVNKKSDKMKKHKNFCIRTNRKFFKILLTNQWPLVKGLFPFFILYVSLAGRKHKSEEI